MTGSALANLADAPPARATQPLVRFGVRTSPVTGGLLRAQRIRRMIVATTENIAGHRTVRTLGQCFGVVVRSRGLAGNIAAGLRSLVGGEITEYTMLLEEARRHAVDRMVQNAAAMGADAVIMMRFDSSEIGQTMSEIVAYGTAVVVTPND